MHKLVLLRHGESQWNLENRFTGWTDIDLTKKGVSGRKAEQSLEKAGITVNKNMVPFDKKSPMITSGIRIGTPALTTRGMSSDEMEIVGKLILRTVTNIGDQAVANEVRDGVAKLASRFPVPGISTEGAWPLK